MPRALFDTPYIFGIHEPGGESHMLEAGKPGWIVFTEGIGSEPNDHGGKDFSPWSDREYGILCRLNNGYYPGGTIPHSSRYEDFARRCANYAAASKGCRLWIIGNEMNHPVERPGVDIDWGREVRAQDPVSTGRSVPWRFNALDDETRSTRMAILNQGEPITPQLYARCYRLCRDAIHSQPGHQADQVLIGAVAPWNNLTKYDGNPNGDWVQYFADILKLLGPQNCDGITIHTYTHSSNPDEIYGDHFMDSPFQKHQYNFRAYRDFLNAVPPSMRHLPAYITETDQDQPWQDENNGWVQRAYGEIDAWNRQTGKQPIRALVLYRWPKIDRWYIEGKNGVIQDFRDSLRNTYQWHEIPEQKPEPPKPAFSVGQTVYAAAEANVRQTPGATGKPKGDVKVKLIPGIEVRVVGGPEIADNLVWWLARCTVAGQAYEGWIAQATVSGIPLLTAQAPIKPVPEPVPDQKPKPEPAPVKPEPAPVEPGMGFKIGDRLTTLAVVNLRQTPGYKNKPADDIQYELPIQSELAVLGGPSDSDGLVWWNVRFRSSQGNTFKGWVAGAKPSGEPLIAPISAVQPEPTLPPAKPQLKIADKVTTSQRTVLRRSPGAQDKPASDALYQIPAGAELKLVEGPEQADGASWWRVRYVSVFGNPFIGWVPETLATGEVLLTPTSKPVAPEPAPTPGPLRPAPGPAKPEQPTGGALKRGDTAITLQIVNLRRTPGFENKPDSDILYEIPTQSQVKLVNGPESVDGLTWWNVQFRSTFGNTFAGWLAQAKHSGAPLLAPAETGPTEPQPGPPPQPEPEPQPEPKPEPAGKFKLGQHVFATAFVNVRQSPGYVNKSAEDVLEEAALGTEVTVFAGPQRADDLTWWNVRYITAEQKPIAGWVAEADAKGQALLSETRPAPPQPIVVPVGKTFQVGQDIVNAFTQVVNIRRSAGYSNKPANDVLAKLPPGGGVTITGGPHTADGLTWWQVTGTVEGQTISGWLAEIGAKGERLMILARWKDRIKLSKPFDGDRRVTQLFADRPDFYKVFSYDGVALRGHNGLDFGLPTGTNLRAADDGEVLRADYDAKGFGNFILLKHAWGESVYAHMKSVALKVGEKVKRGDFLGPSDNTGNSSGPHLHFGIRIYPCRRSDGWGGYCDPVPFMNPDDLIIPDSIRSAGAGLVPPGLAPDQPGRERE